MFLVFARAAIAQTPALLDFEDLPPGTPVYNQYPGVVFLGGDASPSPITIVAPPSGTVSGTQALMAINRGEFTGSGISATFLEGQRRVKLSLGLVDSYFVIPEILAVLRGYDQYGNLVVESPIASLGAAPRAVDVPLEITSADGSIWRAAVTLLNPGSYLSPDLVDLAIDNLEFDVPDVLPPADLVAPLVTVDAPTGGQRVIGSSPGALDVLVLGHVLETGGLSALTLQINGGTPVPIWHGSSSGSRYQFGLHVSGRDGLVDGANTLVVRGEDFSGNGGSATRTFTYQLVPVPPPTDVDFVPVGIEVNQAISNGPMWVFQKENDGFSMTVPDWATVIQGKDTLVRVYAVAEGASGPIANVPATVQVLKDDCTADCFLGELPSMASLTARQPGITLHPAGAPEASLDAMALVLNDTWNFLIPAAWTATPLKLLIDVNWPTPGSGPKQPECEAKFLGECELANRLTAHLTFREPHVATVEPILVRFQGEFEGAQVDEVLTMTDVATTLDDLNTLYPTQWELGPTRSLTVDPNISGGDLLDEVQETFGCPATEFTSPSTWWACAGDPTVFSLALVPDTFADSLDGGGLANAGNGAVWAVNDRISPAHEIGHAIGFEHASCDHKEDAGGGCDGYYPGEHGRIQGIGFDPVKWKLLVDTATDHVHDFMSYGNPRWVSRTMWTVTADYPYIGDVGYDWCFGLTSLPHQCGLEQSGSGRAAAAPVGPMLLVRGRIDGSVATFSDAYAFDVGTLAQSIDPDAPTYQLVALDGAGNTRAVLDVLPLATFEAGPTAASFFAALPLEGLDLVDLATLELRDPDGVRIGALAARSPAIPSVTITSLGGDGPWSRGEVRQIAWDVVSSATVSAQVELHRPGVPGIVLGSQLADGFLDVAVGELPAADEATIVVRVSDGIHTGIAVSAPFAVPAGAPTALIVRPGEAITLDAGVPLALFGLGAGDDGPLADEQLVWSSDRAGELGRGAHLAVTDLAKGVHEITLRAEGPDGQAGLDTVEVTVGGGGCGCASGGPGGTWIVVVGALVLRRGGRRGRPSR